jgi:hypothetical protein
MELIRTIPVAGRRRLWLVFPIFDFVAWHLADGVMTGRAAFSIVTAIMDAVAIGTCLIRLHPSVGAAKMPKVPFKPPFTTLKCGVPA